MSLRNRRHPWRRLLLVAGAMSLFMLGYQWGNRYRQPPSHLDMSHIHGVWVMPPIALPEFQLRDSFGREFARTALENGWTLLAFGDLAHASGQRAVQRLLDVRQRVADQAALVKTLRLVLVTTTETPNLARDFAGLTTSLSILAGESSHIQPLRDVLSATDDDAPTLYVIGPGGQLLALFPETEHGAAMAEDLKAMFHAPETPKKT